MQLRIQKRLAARILKCSKNDVWLDSGRLDEIKEAITKVDVRNLINQDAIKRKPSQGTSKAKEGFSEARSTSRFILKSVVWAKNEEGQNLCSGFEKKKGRKDPLQEKAEAADVRQAQACGKKIHWQHTGKYCRLRCQRG